MSVKRARACGLPVSLQPLVLPVMSTDSSRTYTRILLKLSGEALLGPNRDFGIDETVIRNYAQEIKDAVELGAEIAIVIGGGNIFRGVQNAMKGMTRAHADYMGMLATMINGMALQDALEQVDLQTRLQSSIKMEEIAEPFIRRRAIRHLEKGRVVIFGAGTGNPYFTTDTAAALRGLEIDAEMILKGTRVNGVFSADPEEDASAERFLSIHGDEMIRRNLQVMDMTALTLCRESEMPLHIFDMSTSGNLTRVLQGEVVGTQVHWNEDQKDARVAEHV